MPLWRRFLLRASASCILRSRYWHRINWSNQNIVSCINGGDEFVEEMARCSFLVSTDKQISAIQWLTLWSCSFRNRVSPVLTKDCAGQTRPTTVGRYCGCTWKTSVPLLVSKCLSYAWWDETRNHYNRHGDITCGYYYLMLFDFCGRFPSWKDVQARQPYLRFCLADVPCEAAQKSSSPKWMKI